MHNFDYEKQNQPEMHESISGISYNKAKNSDVKNVERENREEKTVVSPEYMDPILPNGEKIDVLDTAGRDTRQLNVVGTPDADDYKGVLKMCDELKNSPFELNNKINELVRMSGE